MSFITTDLRCEDGHYEIDVIYRRSEGPSPCACGKPREVFYATREMEGQAALEHASAQVGTFRPIKFGDEMYHDRESFDRAVDGYCERNKVTRQDINIEPTPSKAQRSMHRDELRHAAIQKRRESGFDEQTFSRYRAEERERRTYGR